MKILIGTPVPGGECIEQRTVLHVGCGPPDPTKLNPLFKGWREVRLDIDPNVSPDIVASITNMSAVPDESVDGLFSSHNLEHLFAHEVPVALREFHRVLKPGGMVLATMPDLQAVAVVVAKGDLQTVLMQTRNGRKLYRPLDFIFGNGEEISSGNTFMAHKTGFTRQSLGQAVVDAGFPQAQVRRGRFYDLWVAAFKDEVRDAQALLAQAIG